MASMCNYCLPGTSWACALLAVAAAVAAAAACVGADGAVVPGRPAEWWHVLGAMPQVLPCRIPAGAGMDDAVGILPTLPK
mmetsp:Transcript_11326/g.33629  ORF Transcript_11326/g.33629 Transcript_11326/m.33629 type:complete len:80 (-) Transcript_11326:59-298(-)|eukprot:354765-Chlamydomonas_euryale.AAC.4